MIYVSRLFSQISTRLEGDSTLMALLPAGATITNDIGLDNPRLPLITFNMVSDTPSDAFRLMASEVAFDLHVWAERLPSAVPSVSGQTDGMVHACTIVERVIGDWASQTWATGPTFGLDRWKPDMSTSGYACSMLRRASLRTEHEDETLHFIIEFRATMSRTTVQG